MPEEQLSLDKLPGLVEEIKNRRPMPDGEIMSRIKKKSLAEFKNVLPVNLVKAAQKWLKEIEENDSIYGAP